MFAHKEQNKKSVSSNNEKIPPKSDAVHKKIKFFYDPNLKYGDNISVHFEPNIMSSAQFESRTVQYFQLVLGSIE